MIWLSQCSTYSNYVRVDGFSKAVFLPYSIPNPIGKCIHGLILICFHLQSFVSTLYESLIEFNNPLVHFSDQVIWWIPRRTFLALIQLVGTLLLAEGMNFQNPNVNKAWVILKHPSRISILGKKDWLYQSKATLSSALWNLSFFSYNIGIIELPQRGG